jgi:hypothetical protein
MPRDIYVQGAGGGIDLGLLAQAPVKMAKVDAIACPSIGNSVNLLNVTGSGTVNAIWLTVDAAGFTYDGRLQVIVDGEGSPSIDIDLGTLFLAHWNAGTNGEICSTLHMHSESDAYAQLSGVIRFPIPYASSIVIRLFNTATAALGTNKIWSNIIYTPNITAPYRLKSNGVTYANKVSVAAAATATFFTLSNAAGGWLVWFGLVEAELSAANNTYLERTFAAYIDGEGSPSILTSGTEDFFLGSNYYGAGSRNYFSTPWTMITNITDTTANVCHGIDLLAYCGGYKFSSSLKLDLQTDVDTTNSHKMSYVGLYYIPA